MSNLTKKFLSDVTNKIIKNEEELKLSFIKMMKFDYDIDITIAERKTTYGRVDAIFNNKILEFKKPGTLSMTKKYIKALEQTQSYLNNEYKSGVILDGEFFCFTNSTQKIKIDEVAIGVIANYLKNNMSFTKDNIEIIFNPSQDYINKILRLMATEIENQNWEKNGEFEQWKELFSITTSHSESDKSYLTHLKKTELLNIFGDEYKFESCLFALHTLFSFIVKNFVVRELLQKTKRLKRNSFTNPFENLKTFEHGMIFNKANIFNMFNNDIFSWYVDCQTELITELINFRENFIFAYKNVEINDLNLDFFNTTYETIIPHATRKSLGEYYTPPHFAREVLEFGNVDYSKKFIDPTCGSGTFINAVLDKKIEMQESPESIMENIAGTDLNPVAVIAAKANFLLRMLNYVNDWENIFIPIFNVDAIQINEKRSLFKNISLNLEEINPSTRVNFKANVFEYLEFDNRSEYLEILIGKYSHIFSGAEKALYQLENILEQDKKRKSIHNIKQRRYAAMFCDADYIIGNPPWVKWSNLPGRYRSKLKDLGFDSLFSPYKNSGGNSLDLYAPIIMSSSINHLKKDGEIIMIMPMSLNYNASLETVRRFNFLQDNQEIKKIKDYASNVSIFKGVSINFGIYVISNKHDFEYSKIKMVEKKISEEKYFPIQNPHTKVLIPLDSEKDVKAAKKYIGLRDSKYRVRSGVQFSPLKYRQFDLIEEKNGIMTLSSSKVRKVQKAGIDDITIYAEAEIIKPILRTENLRNTNKIRKYCWWIYRPGSKKEMDVDYIKKNYPVFWNSISKIKEKISNDMTSEFNKRISKSSWLGNVRVGDYTQAPYRICFPDNGDFMPVLIENQNEIPEGHVRFIPLDNKDDALRIMNILSKDIVKKIINNSSLKLNKSYIPNYMWIKF